MVTEAEAQRIIEEEKVIAANLSWRNEGNNHRLEAKVLCLDSNEVLNLRGFVGQRNRSFALLYKNIPIRKYTAHDYHRDPVTREQIKQPHKHFWDDEWEDKRVYIPDDIRVGDPNEELLDFLEECNVSLRGHYTGRLFALDAREGGTPS